MTHLELTTQIGPGGWDRLTPTQRCDALAWYMVRTGTDPQESAHQARLRKVRERLGAR